MVFNSSSKAELTNRCRANRAFPSNWLLTGRQMYRRRTYYKFPTYDHFKFASTAVGHVSHFHVLGGKLLLEFGPQVLLRVATHTLKSETVK